MAIPEDWSSWSDDEKYEYTLAFVQSRMDAAKSKSKAKPECRKTPLVNKSGKITKPATVPCGSGCRQPKNCKVTKGELRTIRRRMRGASKQELAEAVKAAIAAKKSGKSSTGAVYGATKEALGQQGRDRLERKKQKAKSRGSNGTRNSASSNIVEPEEKPEYKMVDPQDRLSRMKSKDGLIVAVSPDFNADLRKYPEISSRSDLEHSLEWRVRKASDDELSRYQDRLKGLKIGSGRDIPTEAYVLERRSLSEGKDVRYVTGDWTKKTMGPQPDQLIEDFVVGSEGSEYSKGLRSAEDPSFENIRASKIAKQEKKRLREMGYASRRKTPEEIALDEASMSAATEKWPQYVDRQVKSAKGKKMSVTAKFKDGTEAVVPATVYGDIAYHKEVNPDRSNTGYYQIMIPSSGVRIFSTEDSASAKKIAAILSQSQIDWTNVDQEGNGLSSEHRDLVADILKAFKFGTIPEWFVSQVKQEIVATKGKSKKSTKTDSLLGEGYFGLNPNPFDKPLWRAMGIA